MGKRNRRKEALQTDERGRTRLFYAAESGNLEAVKGLVNGVMGTGIFSPRLTLIKHKDAQGLTAIDVARAAGHEEIADFLSGEKSRMEWCE